MSLKITKSQQKEIAKIRKMIDKNREKEDAKVNSFIKSMKISKTQEEIVWSYIYNNDGWALDLE